MVQLVGFGAFGRKSGSIGSIGPIGSIDSIGSIGSFWRLHYDYCHCYFYCYCYCYCCSCSCSCFYCCWCWCGFGHEAQRPLPAHYRDSCCVPWRSAAIVQSWSRRPGMSTVHPTRAWLLTAGIQASVRQLHQQICMCCCTLEVDQVPFLSLQHNLHRFWKTVKRLLEYIHSHAKRALEECRHPKDGAEMRVHPVEGLSDLGGSTATPQHPKPLLNNILIQYYSTAFQPNIQQQSIPNSVIELMSSSCTLQHSNPILNSIPIQYSTANSVIKMV